MGNEVETFGGVVGGVHREALDRTLTSSSKSFENIGHITNHDTPEHIVPMNTSYLYMSLYI